MTKFSDYSSCVDVPEMMDKLAKMYPGIFDGFQPDKVTCISVHGKKSKFPIKVSAIKFPYSIFSGESVFICEVFSEHWQELTAKKKALAVFHSMCSISQGAFDPESKNYAKRRKPDFTEFAEVISASGGKIDWLNDDSGVNNPLDGLPADIVATLEENAQSDAGGESDEESES